MYQKTKSRKTTICHETFVSYHRFVIPFHTFSRAHIDFWRAPGAVIINWIARELRRGEDPVRCYQTTVTTEGSFNHRNGPCRLIHKSSSKRYHILDPFTGNFTTEHRVYRTCWWTNNLTIMTNIWVVTPKSQLTTARFVSIMETLCPHRVFFPPMYIVGIVVVALSLGKWDFRHDICRSRLPDCFQNLKRYIRVWECCPTSSVGVGSTVLQ